MKMKDLKEMGEEQLQAKARELAEELQQLREDVRTGKEKNHARIAQLKKDVARVMTVLSNNQVQI